MPKRATSSGYEEPKGGLTATAIRGLIIEILAGATDADEAGWANVVGAVETMPVWSSPKSNWRVNATGSRGDKRAVEAAAEIVRQQHPYAKVEQIDVR